MPEDCGSLPKRPRRGPLVPVSMKLIKHAIISRLNCDELILVDLVGNSHVAQQISPTTNDVDLADNVLRRDIRAEMLKRAG